VFTGLEYLNISNTNISSIPKTMASLIKLQFFNISCCPVTSLPAEVWGMSLYELKCLHCPPELLANYSEITNPLIIC